MKIALAAVCGLLAVAPPAMAAHAQDDDWELAEDAGQQLSIAAVRYDGGSMIVVQCKAGALTAVITGLPPSTGGLGLEATRADGRHDLQDWASAGAPGAIRSETAARDVRFMRGGGAYAVHTPAGVAPALSATFDLPAQSANLDRVLTACGWATTDDRDLLTRASHEVSLSEPRPTTLSRGSRRNPSRDIAGQGRQVERPAPRTPTPAPAEGQISCIIRNMHLTECRRDHPPVAGVPVDPRLASLEGHQVYAPAGSDLEGKVLYMAVAGGRVTVIDYIATIPG